MTTTAHTSLLHQLANGDIQLVLQRLLNEKQAILTATQRETVIIQSAKWQQLQQAELQGVQSADQVQIGRNQVIAALTSICQSLSQVSKGKENYTTIIQRYRNRFKSTVITFAPHFTQKKLAQMLKYFAECEVIIPKTDVLCMAADSALGITSGLLFTKKGIHVDRHGDNPTAGFISYADIGSVKTGRYLLFFHQLYLNGEAFQILDEQIGKADRELLLTMIRELAGLK
ncbi:MAG: hypothetical protein AB8G22_02180 [Saprospiraceae bacterium]